MAHRIQEKQLPAVPLRVLHRGLAMVPDYRALMDTGTRRHVGLKFDATLGKEDVFVHPVSGEQYTGNHGGFVKLVDEVVTIPVDDPHYGEYVRHLQQGDLWAADLATASAAGILFEPDFGGEHPETSAGDEAKKVQAERDARQAAHLKAAKEAESKGPKPGLVSLASATETSK